MTKEMANGYLAACGIMAGVVFALSEIPTMISGCTKPFVPELNSLRNSAVEISQNAETSNSKEDINAKLNEANNYFKLVSEKYSHSTDVKIPEEEISKLEKQILTLQTVLKSAEVKDTKFYAPQMKELAHNIHNFADDHGRDSELIKTLLLVDAAYAAFLIGALYVLDKDAKGNA